MLGLEQAAVGFPFSKVLRAKDGPKQAHREVLVACLWKQCHVPAILPLKKCILPNKMGVDDMEIP